MKEIDWPSPCGYTVFCDDIRQEVSGKHSLIGAYTGVLLINGTFPFTLPKFAMYVVYTERPGSDVPTRTLKVFFPGEDDNKPRVSAELPPFPKDAPEAGETVGPDPRTLITLPIILGPTKFKEKGRIRVRMFRGEEVIKLGALSVDTNPDFDGKANQDTSPSD